MNKYIKFLYLTLSTKYYKESQECLNTLMSKYLLLYICHKYSNIIFPPTKKKEDIVNF